MAEKQWWQRGACGEEQNQSWRLNVQDTQPEKQWKQVDGEAVEAAEDKETAEVKLMIL